jgi:hypothetical protein
MQPVTLYPFRRFKILLPEVQLEQLTLHAVSFELARCAGSREAVLFAYHDFYVELLVEKITDEIHSIRCFRSLQKLEPYLEQIDISEITALLACKK